MRVLIVEDDVDLSNELAEYLAASDFIAKVENKGEDGLFEGMEGGYDAIILDLGLPDMDGITILEKWREAGIVTPVIILTARDSKMDIVRGLDAGADDYVIKDSHMTEIAARLKANIRRASGQLQKVLKSGNVTFETDSNQIFVDGKFKHLTQTEFQILQYLFMKQGKTISAEELAERAYVDYDNDSTVIARHISNIRKKTNKEVIKTEASRGYYVPMDKA